MKSIKALSFIVACLITTWSNAQFAPDYDANFNTQKDYWDNYYMDVRADCVAVGNYSMGGTGYSGYQRWKTIWELYVPISGSFDDGFDARQAAMNQIKYDHFKTYVAPGGTPNALIVPPQEWDEIGPINLSEIKGDYGGSWSNPHISNTGASSFAGHTAKVDRIFQHPNSDDKFYACVGGIERGGGGLFVKDGASDWKVLGTDLLPNPKVASLAIKPLGAFPDPSVEYLFIALSTGAVYRASYDGINEDAVFWLECGYNGDVPYPYVTNSGLNDSLSLPFAFDYSNTAGGTHEKIGKIEFAKKDATSNEYSRLVVARLGGLFYSDTYNAAIIPDLSNYTLDNDIIWTEFDALTTLVESIPDVAVFPDVVHKKEYWYTDFESFERNGVITYITSVNVIERELTDNNPLGNTRQYIAYSTDFGVSWSFFHNGLADSPHGEEVARPNNQNKAVFKVGTNIEVHKSNPNYIYFAATTIEGGAFWVMADSYSLRRYDFVQDEWENLSVIDDFINRKMVTQPHAFVVSPTDDENWWFYTNAIHKSVNGIVNEIVPTAYADYSQRFHADVRDVLVLNDNNLMLATDGGVYECTDGGEYFNINSEGLGAAHTYSMGVAQQPPFYLATGTWHSGFQAYNPDTDEWHWGRLSDGQHGDVFFLNKERFTFSDQESIHKIVKGFDSFGGFNLSGPTKGSENISGRSYSSRRNATPDFDDLVFNNNDYASSPVTTLNQTFLFGSSKPFVIPNDPDRVVVLEFAGLTSQKLHFYTGLSDIQNPTATLEKTVDLFDVFNDNFAPGTGTPNFLGIVFDPRQNGIHYMILKATGLGSQDPAGRRIVEYNPVTDEYDDITFVTDDDINGQAAQFPGFYTIRDIEIDRQTGVLYIGTNHGVYYLDRANSIWRNFSTNVPMFNTDLGIVHCTGELHVSSTNRGIWKTDLIRDEQTPTLEWEITQNTTWNERINLFCTLIVKSGNTLYVNDELIVFGDQKIIVEPGARLVIQNDGIITSNCGTFWKGIEVWGDNTAIQQAQYQGMVTLLSGGTIQNATNAISVWKDGDWNSMGGIVQADDAHFIDNKRDVQFMPYSGASAGSSIGNVSYFIDSEFKTTTSYMGTTVAPHVTMFKVDGVRFTACEFGDDREVAVHFKNKGIHSLDSKFTVRGQFIGTSPVQIDNFDNAFFNPTTFTNLAHGIWSGSAVSQNTILVDHTLFTDCLFGLTLSQIDNAVISRNKFDRTTGADWMGQGYQYDIITDRSTAYFIEGNLITKQTPEDPVIGITNQDSGEENEEVRMNRIFEVDHGVYSYGRNKNDFLVPDNAGLEYLCNAFTDNLVQDELIAGSVTGDGLKIQQGIVTSPSGNEFTDVIGSPISYNLNSTLLSQTQYFYYDNSSGDIENPDIVSSTITKTPTGVQSSCVSNFDLITPRNPSIVSASSAVNLATNHENYLDDLDEALADLEEEKDPVVIETLEQDIVFLNRELRRISNVILKQAMLDSTVIDSSQCVNWIIKRNDVMRYQQLADFYLGKGDLTTGTDYLDLIHTEASNFPRGGFLETEFLDFEDFKRDLLPHLDANGNIQDFDSTIELIARDAATNKTGIAKVQGQNLLCFFLGECTAPPAIPTQGERSMEQTNDSENVFEMEESDRLTIYPNPSSSEIVVSLDSGALPITIVIVDAEGKEVLTMESYDAQQAIDISSFKTGNYYVLVKDQKGRKYMKKLIKN